MAGVKGSGGPPPKRSDQRRRTNTPAAGEPTKVVDDSLIVIPNPDDDWHPTARIVWDSLHHSGQKRFYTSTDWSSAYLLCDAMSMELSPQPVVDKEGNVTMVRFPPKGASLSAWRTTMAALLMTEGDRRRAALELTTPKPEGESKPAPVTSLASWKASMA